MDDERLFEEDLTADEAAALRARSEPARIVHSKEDYEREKSPLVRAAASWTTAAVVSGSSENEAAESIARRVTVTAAPPAVTSEPHTAQYA